MNARTARLVLRALAALPALIEVGSAAGRAVAAALKRRRKDAPPPDETPR